MVSPVVVRVSLAAVTLFCFLSAPFMLAWAPTGEPAELSDSIVMAGPPVPYDYHTFSEIEAMLASFEASYPDIVSVIDIGDSWEKTNGSSDNDVLAVKISDNVDVEEDEPELLVMALHHAREWPTAEIAIRFIQNMTQGYGTDARLSWLVDNRETWIIPVTNPDGLEYSMTVDDMWRKNRRDNLDGTYGVDLNRNYNGSENGDPAGDWGGEGTSNLTSSDVYCGEAPFSEPETQAIRDLVNAHEFQIGIDFHSYGEWVMWPWSYNYNITPDNDDLVRIGNEFAAINGYTAAQGIELYATTGDSTDWLYGHSRVFAYCVEVGSDMDNFHPEDADSVERIISENVPLAILAAEICGDRQERQFNISHTPPGTLTYSASGWDMSADITAARGVDTADLSLFYRVDGGSWQETSLGTTAANNTYVGAIPSQPVGSVIDYYFVAHDLGGVEAMSPTYAPYELYSATVYSGPSSPPVADAGDDTPVAVGSSHSFDGSGSSDDVAIVSYTWTFDDGGAKVLTGIGPSYTFDNVDTFEVTLTVEDGDGQTDTDTVSITVYDDVDPVADAGTGDTISVGDQFTFDGTGSTDNEGIVSWVWTFTYNGSLATLSGETVQFTFWTVEIYTVTLNVTDGSGNWDTATVTVEVLGEPIPEFSSVMVPVAATLAILVLMARRRKRPGSVQ